MNIFIISPATNLVYSLKKILNHEGYNVTSVSNINEAIICFKSIINSSGFIDLIILDDDLSDDFSSGQFETGLNFINHFNEEFKSIGYYNGIRVIKTPILIMSSKYSGIEETIEGYNKLGHSIIGKPLHQERLILIIPKVIKQWRQKVISDLDYIGYSITFDGFFHLRP
ncbi:unnamed protein product, partial [marine sediment metagenome]